MLKIVLEYGIQVKSVSASTDVPILSLGDLWGWPIKNTIIGSFPGNELLCLMRRKFGELQGTKRKVQR